jgi:hypothetical protein
LFVHGKPGDASALAIQFPTRQRIAAVIRACPLLLLLVLGLAAPTFAASPTFLPGARVGLVPPEGMVPSASFQGYEDAGRGAMLFITELGAETSEHVAQDFTPEALKAGGIEVETREDAALAGMRGYLIIAHQDVAGAPWRKWALVLTRGDITAILVVMTPEAAREAYPDATLRASLATLTLRESVPDDEKFGRLPYRFGDLAGFRLIQAIPGGTAVLTSGPSDATIASSQPFFMVQMAASAPGPAERESFARRMLAGTIGLDQFHVVQSGPIRFGPQAGHELIAEGKDPRNGVELSFVQWLRFGSAGYMRMLGIARRDVWAEAFPRMRALRDGIEFK